MPTLPKSPWITPGYEILELSTQRIIAAALARGIKIEVLDQVTQWVRLRKNGKTEIIRQGSETSADSYVTGLILGDKSIQKTLLTEAQIRVPQGQKYDDQKLALDDFPCYQKGQWVIKPTTTNYGVGITMLPQYTSLNRYKQALTEAFSHDQSVIIEEFIPGIECRFLVIGGVCRAVLHRIPAHVEADGQHSIKELIDQKNKNPLRGSGYKTPLEKIKCSTIEEQVLSEQNLNFESIPPKGQKAWLRNNSNISTGGDSIDYTDIVHPEYKRLAEKACQTAGAQICGVDIMMSDHPNPPRDNNHGIIELNYNPVLYFHDFPSEGTNRNVAPYILDVLGF